MKSLRIITIAFVLTWLIGEIFYAPLARHFIHSIPYSFLSGWESQMDNSGWHFLTSLGLFFSVWFMSFCISMTFATFIYPVLEKKVMELF